MSYLTRSQAAAITAEADPSYLERTSIEICFIGISAASKKGLSSFTYLLPQDVVPLAAAILSAVTKQGFNTCVESSNKIVISWK